jgi:hypothetical protein
MLTSMNQLMMGHNFSVDLNGGMDLLCSKNKLCGGTIGATWSALLFQNIALFN